LKKYFLFLITIIIIQSCSTSPQLISTDNSLLNLKANLEFLASDELEGRETASRGEKLAALYISKELQKYGIKPFADNETYFQEFEMSLKGISGNSNIIIYNSLESKEILNGSNVFYNPMITCDTSLTNKKYPIVYVGYGISSEEKQFNNYSGIDVSNKVVLLKSRIPESFNKTEDKKLSQWRYKISNAKKHGAKGVILIADKKMESQWTGYANWATSSRFKLIEEDTAKETPTIPMVVLSIEESQNLFQNELFSYDEISENDSLSFDLIKQVEFQFSYEKEIKTARNVIGIKEGLDEKLKNEYIVITAHYDHLGKKGEKTFNGADDDGSGVVAILETMRQLSLQNNNKRSVVVAFHTAEEKGLKGSKYLTANSSFIKSTIANINIDMVGRKSVDSIYSIGSKKMSTEFGKLVEEANAQTAKFVLDYKFDDPKDPNRFYYRSDHVNYVNNGIPIVFFYDYMMDDYHKPSDTVDKINFEKINKMSNLVYHLSLKLANLDHKLVLD